MEWRRYIIESRLYHVPLWLAYQYFWFWLFGTTQQLLTLPGMLLFGGYLVGQAGGSYVVIDFLMPRFLSERRYLLFGVLFMLTAGVSTFIIILCYYVALPVDAWERFYASGRFWPATLVSTLNTLTVVLLLKLGRAWVLERQQIRALERENLETELKFLRAQWNPHFLFNTINSIYMLIKKDPDLAAESLARFSDLLRYQLYECNVSWVSLERELQFIQNFIALECLRKSRLKLQSNLEEINTEGQTIAPNILLPFVENAFKYAPTAAEPEVRIRLEHKTEGWQFEVANTFQDQKITLPKAGRIGLQNVRRRLDLTYPNQHALEVKTADGWFRIRLTIREQMDKNKHLYVLQK